MQLPVTWSWSEIIAKGNMSKKQLAEYVVFVVPNVPKNFVIRVFD